MKFSASVIILGLVGSLSSGRSLERRAGYVDLMPPSQAATYKALLPNVSSTEIDSILKSADTMWYDEKAIVPGYQDAMFDPQGFRPNTISPETIDTAVPGGWRKLFASRGKFHFPFMTGGANLSDNMVKINFWHAPQANGNVLPVVYWKHKTINHLKWMFPVGTIIGEVLMIKFTDGDLRVFEIRTRRRELDKWTNLVFRPFPTSTLLVQRIKQLRPDWKMSVPLSQAMKQLENPATLTSRTLETTQYQGTFDTVNGYLDLIPDLGSVKLTKQLLKETTFQSVSGQVWKSNRDQITYAAGTKNPNSIVPKNYDGGMLPVDDVSCRRCHKDAGRQIGEFYSKLVAYGELWGEDEIFSWHPFETSAFVNADGSVKNFNNDNRRLRADMVSAGLLKAYDASNHDQPLYKALNQDWVYKTIWSRNLR